MSLNPPLVALVNDDQVDLFIAQKTIQICYPSMEVITFPSGAKALDYLERHSLTPHQLPDVLFLDINMPEMSGWDFLTHYQRQLSDLISKEIHIYILTSSENYTDLRKAQLNPLVKELLVKPLTAEKLESILPPFQRVVSTAATNGYAPITVSNSCSDASIQ